MKVVEIYSKKDLDILTCQGKVVSKVMDYFFSMFPSEYRGNYDRNLRGLEIWKVDEAQAGSVNGEYFESFNIMILRGFDSIIHELMHVASCDSKTKISAFKRMENVDFFENSLIEGMTEYLASIAMDNGPSDYFFETFAAAMLSNIDGILEPYFIPSHSKFMSLFPQKKHILSLMYALNYYATKLDEVMDKKIEFLDDNTKGRVEHSIRDVIDSLIDIQLSMKMSKKDNVIYGDKFMELITSDIMDDCLGIFSGDYMDYANEQINKRVLRRIR